MSSNPAPSGAEITSVRMLMMLALLLSYSSMFNNISLPNERSRLYLAIAQVDNGTFSIDAPLRTYGRIGDRARYQGRHFSDKAPGTGLMGGMVYRAVRLFTEPSDWNVASLLRLMRRCLGIPFALLGFIWLRRLLHRYGLSKLSIEWSSWSWMLGTAAFHYSGTFFGHQIAAALLVGSMLYLHHGIHERRLGALWGSGFLSGLAVVTEYQAALGVAALGVYTLAHIRTAKFNVMLWILGGVPMALLLGYYHQACFGDPFSLPYEHLAAATYRKIHGAGIAGVTQPEWEGLRLWLVNVRRGLFSTSPVYILSFIGLVSIFRSDWRSGVTFLFFGAAILLFLSGAHIWSGDWGYGPRIIVFALGLLSIPLAFAIDQWRQNRIIMAVIFTAITYGLICHQVQHFFFPEPWSKSQNPLFDIAFPMLLADFCAPNLLTVYFKQSVLISAIPVLFMLTLLYRWLLQVYVPTQKLIYAFPVIAITFGLLYLTSLAPTAGLEIQEDWLKLIRLWHGRETQYH